MLRLVVVLPDGTPGMVAADATDVFGSDAAVLAGLATTLSVEGFDGCGPGWRVTRACRRDRVRPVTAGMGKAHLTGSAPTRPGGEPCEESG
ncbi:hypothetical protein I546_7288 [Mycobacterium kansasii 732]|nr:hypothetical protein I546_7288 [Mycobacterium kansasii 732]